MSYDFKKLSEEVIFNGFRKVLKRVYKLPDGNTKEYFVNSGSDVVVMFCLTKDNQVVLVEQFRFGPEKNIIELPAGTLEADEDPKEAAKRELLEETGYSGDVEFVTSTYNGAYNTHKRYTYVFTNGVKVSEQNLDEDEFIKVKLMDIKELRTNLKNSNMTHLECAFLAIDHLGLL